MKVYRYLSEEELNNMVANNTSELGHTFIRSRNIGQENIKINNHHYQKNEKYLHFFKKLSDIEYIRSEYRENSGNYYFAEFEIPKYILIMCSGRGYYESLRGYDNPVDTVVEYALKSKYFNPGWLISYTLDANKKQFIHENAYQSLSD